MPPIRITASNSSKHTPKSIARHQLIKSTGLNPSTSKKKNDSKRQVKSVVNKTDYTITGYDDANLYPDFNVNLEDDEDEIIEEDEDIMSDVNPVIRGMKFLINNRYDSNIPPVSKGVITKKFKERIMEKRMLYPPIIIKNQLYALFVNEITKIDKEIENLIMKGDVMKLLINHIQFNDNLIILTRDYLQILNSKMANEQDLEKFERLICENNGISIVTRQDLQQYGISNVTNLINHGFLNFNPQDQLEYYISLPNLGNYLNFLKNSMSLINFIISKSNTRQILEKKLIEKWELNYNNWYKFYGLNLKFILSLNYGMGLVENFNTNVGNGWKLT